MTPRRYRADILTRLEPPTAPRAETDRGEVARILEMAPEDRPPIDVPQWFRGGPGEDRPDDELPF